jgi:hypothetical protein
VADETTLLACVRSALATGQDLDPVSIAEALWLAAHAPPPATPPKGSDHSPPETPGPAIDPSSGRRGPSVPARRRQAGTRAAKPVAVAGRLVQVRYPRPAAEQLDMLRSLRPFKRRWTRGRRHELDIDATVQAYARTSKLIPQFRAAPERWFEADVVIDDSPSMALWAAATARLGTLLGQLGAFRTVRTWRISVTGAAPELSNKGGQPSGTGQLRSPDGRRLIIIVSDGSASGWFRAEAWQLVRSWAESTPTALISPLPTRLWSRTGLGLPAVRVGPGAPGSPNRLLRYSLPVTLRLGADSHPDWLPVPASTLTAHMLGRWARTVMKGDPRGCDALLVPASRLAPEGEQDDADTEDRSDTTGAQLVDAFCRTASPAATRLAVLCAPFSAVNLPLLELLARELVDEASQGDLAEVIVGGLFYPAAGPPGRRTAHAALQFRPGVRERLREILPETEAWRVYKAISSHIVNGSGLTNTFTTGFPDPDDGVALPDALRPFSVASLEVLTFLDALPAANPPAEPPVTSPSASGPAEGNRAISPARDDMPPDNASAGKPQFDTGPASSPRQLAHPQGFQVGERARDSSFDAIRRQGEPATGGLARARDLVLGTARRDGRGRFDLIGDGGLGKTRLLGELAEGLRGLGFATLFITISPQRRNGDEASEADRLLGDELVYQKIIADLAEDVREAWGTSANGRVLDEATASHIRQQMLAAINVTREQQENAAPGISGQPALTGPGIEQRVSAGGDALVSGRDIAFYQSPSGIDLLRARWAASLKAFVAAVRELTDRCPLAILVDDLHLILGTGAGNWLLGVLDELPGILVVHARRPDATRDVLGAAQVIRLRPMNREETQAYARDELPGWAPAAATELGTLIFKLTGGYPVWVGIYCQIIATETPPGTPVGEVRERLLGDATVLSGEERTVRFGGFVDDYCAGLLGTSVPVFDVLSVLRRINLGLLTSLLAEHGVDERACGRLFAWLRESRFMTASDDGGPSDDDEPDIRLHDIIRHQAERLLRLRDPIWYRKLHASAERYYRKTMNLDQEPEEGVAPFQYGTRYEQIEWQVNSFEWLHHAGQVDDEAFAQVTRAMIRLFLYTFWWYESDFPLRDDYHYSQALLADYRALPRRQSGEQWLRNLEAFRENYVADTPNRAPGRDRERWELAQDALRGLWGYLQLDQGSVPVDRDLRRIQILLSIFRGDAEWFGGSGDEPSRERAARWYTEAEREADPDESDRWIANWARYLKACLYVKTNPSLARELTLDLPEWLDEQSDHELRVHLTWLYGDLAWYTDDKARAFDIYTRTVLHSFVYHLRQEYMPQNPSLFTVASYQMYVDRTRRRLAEAREEGLGELAGTATARMNALFAPYWARVRRAPDADNAEGFPAQPAPADLGTVDSEFAETVQWMLDAMNDRLEEPLAGPLLLP